MLTEAIQKIVHLADEARKPIVEPVPHDTRHVRVLLNERVEFVEIPPPPLDNVVYSLDALVGVIRDTKGGNGLAGVWHSDAAITAQFLNPSNEDRRDRVSLPLTYTPGFHKILELAARPCRLDQATFLRLLRFTLGVDPAVVALFRKMDWSSSAAASGNVTFGASRMGKSIEAEVQGMDQLPEEILVATRVFIERLGQPTARVRCWVDLDVHAQSIALVPDQESIEEARDLMHDYLQTVLSKELESVYYGTPIATVG